MASTKEDREKAVRQSLANSALEGLQPSAEFRALLDRYIAGEISLESAIESISKQYEQNTTGSAS